MSNERRAQKIEKLKEDLVREERQLSKARYYANDAFQVMTQAKGDYESWTRTASTVSEKIAELEELIEMLEEQ